ncbi:adenylyltransferase/cytidyltransferase family protein [Roseateles sp. BYS96W]|uniref:Adenylyltransferase/cytidyltransferase family protein n=1 Tax=Pelomonas nitida TaxID=3299027 RepID=A0ABW7G4W6_9BURK
MTQALLDKIVLDDATIEARVAELPGPIVFTNGVFDILHRGHVSYLQAARDLGGSLVLGLNSDASARQLGKGPDRPLNAELDRAFVLAGLSSVSLVVFFDERTPVSLLRRVRADIYVKGGDYDMESLEETTVVRSWGGRSLAIPFVDGYSTTSLVRRIRGNGV